MYDSKAEAEKNYLYTSRVIAIFFLLTALTFILMAKKNAITYIAINLSPIEAIAIYDKSIKINRYKIDTYFKYVDVNGGSHTYYEFDKKIRGQKELKILYSKYFPSVSYPLSELDNLIPDFYIFVSGCLFFAFFILIVTFYGVRIYVFKK